MLENKIDLNKVKVSLLHEKRVKGRLYGKFQPGLKFQLIKMGCENSAQHSYETRAKTELR